MFWSSTSAISSSYFSSRLTVIIATFTIVALVLLSHALPLQNHGTLHQEKRSDVVCGAPSWDDIIAFFLLNYVAHAATVRHFPGDSTKTQMWWTACALFVPFAGVWRACQSIANARPFEKNELERAKYAGALCVVNFSTTVSSLARANRRRPHTTSLVGCRLRGTVKGTPDEDGFVRCRVLNLGLGSFRVRRAVSQKDEKIQGSSRKGMYIVPPEVKVFNRVKGKVVLSSSSSMIKCGVAIVQISFACLTLYRARSDQVAKYGYAAFGLTVIPYAIMSIINLIANLMTPEYPAIFMAHSDCMGELETKSSKFDGVVGTIVPDEPSDHGFYYQLQFRQLNPHEADAWIQIPDGYVAKGTGDLEVEVSRVGRHETIPDYAETQKVRNRVAIGIGVVALVTPYILIAIFTNGFKTGSISTPVQRGFVISWLVVGQVFGAFSGFLGHQDSTRGNVLYNKVNTKEYVIVSSSNPAGTPMDNVSWLYITIVWMILLAAITPGLGGFIVVGLMIKQFGSCVLI